MVKQEDRILPTMNLLPPNFLYTRDKLSTLFIVILVYFIYVSFFPLLFVAGQILINNPWAGETVADFIFLGSKITADGDCSHEIKRCLLFGRKVMTNLDSILKSRDITLPTKVRLVKTMVFPVVMNGCESWTLKKAKR